jgi:phospholipid transport system substrate-binding protein
VSRTAAPRRQAGADSDTPPAAGGRERGSTMHTTRRQTLLSFAALAAAAAVPSRALALTEQEARDFVARVADEVTALIQSGAPARQQAERFTGIFKEFAAHDQIARFVMGRTWREMNDSQKQRFREAFVDYVGRVYANLLGDYEGQTVKITGSRDFGEKGIMVNTIATGGAAKDSALDWLVSDRGGGGPQVVDITAEGVSLLQTQRQEFAAMIERRGGDVDRFISDLAAGKIEADRPDG